MHDVVDAEYAAEYTCHVHIIDKDVWYVFSSYEQFVNQVPGNDVRRARLVRRKKAERKFFRRQLPLAGAVDAGADDDWTHDGALKLLVGQQQQQIGQVDDHVVVRLQQVANT